MMRETSTAERFRVAIEELSDVELVRLQLLARIFDSRRYEDLLQEAITRTLSGERTWREGIPLRWHLHQTMRSIAWSWAKKPDENLGLESLSPEEGALEDGLQDLEALTPDPERQAVSRTMLEQIVEACGPDPVVVGLVSGKLQGKTGPEIRKELGLTQKDYCAAAQRLRRAAREALSRRQRYA